MTLQELKQQIESRSMKDTFIIFKGKNHFISNQYYRAIAEALSTGITYLEDLSSLNSDSFDIFFGGSTDNNLRVFNVDTLDYYSDSLLREQRLVILCKNVEKSTQTLYKDHIVEVDELEEWQIQDYLYSIAKGMDTKYIDWLIKRCNGDIHRLQLEIDKLLIFEENERNIVFNMMVQDNAFSDTTDDNIFDFTDAIVKRNIEKLKTIYDVISSIDIEDIGVVTVLYKNFLKLVSVWLGNNPTPQSTGMSSKQIYAISRLPRVWTGEQLVHIMDFLTGIDYKIKTGALPVNQLRDYIVVNLLSLR